MVIQGFNDFLCNFLYISFKLGRSLSIEYPGAVDNNIFVEPLRRADAGYSV
jgi:hypothetical protein